MRFGIAFWVLRFAILAAFLTLFFFAQRFWFRKGFAVVGRLHSPAWRRVGRRALTSFAVLLVVALADRLFLHLLPNRAPVARFFQWTQLWLFSSSCAFLLVKAVRGVEWLWTKATLMSKATPTVANGSIDPERRALFRYAGYVAGALPLIAGFYGFARERLNFTVRRADVPIANLPPALDGFRIIQMSDVHMGDFMPADEVRRAVEIANGLGAHLAVLTGDLITGKGDPLRTCVAELSRLKAPLGIFGCNGNHEIYAEAEDETEQLFQRFGMKLLREENAQLEWNGSKLNLIGVDYQRERRSLSTPLTPMLQGINSLVRRDMPNILLSHNPNSFPRAAEMGIELSLAGHTHGGQIKVEIIDHSLSPARFITDFVAGLYSLPMSSANGNANGHAHLYVNSGLGTIGVPARIGVEPEITLLTLRRAA